jgi:hypothetical protein
MITFMFFLRDLFFKPVELVDKCVQTEDDINTEDYPFDNKDLTSMYNIYSDNFPDKIKTIFDGF